MTARGGGGSCEEDWRDCGPGRNHAGRRDEPWGPGGNVRDVGRNRQEAPSLVCGLRAPVESEAVCGSLGTVCVGLRVFVPCTSFEITPKDLSLVAPFLYRFMMWFGSVPLKYP